MNLVETLLFRKAWSDAFSYHEQLVTPLTESAEKNVELVKKYRKSDSTIANTLYQIFMFGEDSDSIYSENDLLNRLTKFVELIGDQDGKTHKSFLVFKDDEKLLGKGQHERGIVFDDGSSIYLRFTDKTESGMGGMPFFIQPGIGEANIRREILKDVETYKRSVISKVRN